MHPLRELAQLFLKLGTIGFGGPAVHIAIMEEEVVERRGWMDHQQFLDLVGATNLIPGPNSTEMAIHIGYVRAGMRGLLVAGSCFLLPAIMITTVLAALYVQYGQMPQVASILATIKPAVLAIILTAGWRLGRKAIRSRQLAGIALLVASGPIFWPGNEILILLGGSLLGCVLLSRDRPASNPPVPPKATDDDDNDEKVKTGKGFAGIGMLAMAPAVVSGKTLLAVFLSFLKVGAVLYGTGYVLIAYLDGELVQKLGWLQSDQLIDAIAIGQFTPGPILSTATFIGFLVMEGQGIWMQIAGATVATLGIFLPSFLLVAITGPMIPRLRSHRGAAIFLDSVNAASMGLMGAVVLKFSYPLLFQLNDRMLSLFGNTWTISVPGGVKWISLLILLGASIASIRYRVSPALLVLAAILIGLIQLAVGG
jgi:chromate transporter|tara:strand:- start:3276 stop:4547 length:1272 start_codon:yes stop_codon:yes gene_type:complete